MFLDVVRAAIIFRRFFFIHELSSPHCFKMGLKTPTASTIEPMHLMCLQRVKGKDRHPKEPINTKSKSGLNFFVKCDINFFN